MIEWQPHEYEVHFVRINSDDPEDTGDIRHVASCYDLEDAYMLFGSFLRAGLAPMLVEL